MDEGIFKRHLFLVGLRLDRTAAGAAGNLQVCSLWTARVSRHRESLRREYAGPARSKPFKWTGYTSF